MVNRRLFKYGRADDLLDFAETALNPELFLDDRNQHVNTDRNPDLSLHGVFRCAVKGLDVQVLFDPFEEEFDLPPTPVKLSDDQRRLVEVVREKSQSSSTLAIIVADIAQWIRICLLRMADSEHDRLVAAQSGGVVNRTI